VLIYLLAKIFECPTIERLVEAIVESVGLSVDHLNPFDGDFFFFSGLVSKEKEKDKRKAEGKRYKR